MDKSIRRIIISVVCVGILLLILLGVGFGPAIIRYYAYRRLMSDPKRATAARIVPQETTIPESDGTSTFHLGYARISISSEDVNEVKVLYNGCLVIDCNTTKFAFLAPVNMNDPCTDFGGSKDFSTFIVNAAETQPRPWIEIVTMSAEHFVEYLPLLYYKVTRRNSENGIIIFDAPESRGIIYLGERDKPARIEAEVFSKQSGLSQLIIVNSDAASKSKSLMTSLLASYELLITDELTPDEIQSLILAGLSKNENVKVEIAEDE